MEGTMRQVFLASSVLVLAMIGYAVSGISAQTNSPWPISTGDRIRLWYPGESGVNCTVALIRNDFVRCAPDPPVDRFSPLMQRDEWFNLRTLRSIERLPTNER
jgi:hypothetical protein